MGAPNKRLCRKLIADAMGAPNKRLCRKLVSDVTSANQKLSRSDKA